MLEGVKTSAGWESKARGITKKIEWMLGDSTPAADAVIPPERVSQPDVPAWVIRRSTGTRPIPEFGWYADYNSRTASRTIVFNQTRGGVNGTLYYPAKASPDAKLPVVIWLHSYSYPLGYMWVYHRDVHPILALVDAGYAVLAYDQSGFGSRMDENSQACQDRFPHWSQMGRMVEDARAAAAALGDDPMVNPKRSTCSATGLAARLPFTPPPWSQKSPALSASPASLRCVPTRPAWALAASRGLQLIGRSLRDWASLLEAKAGFPMTSMIYWRQLLLGRCTSSIHGTIAAPISRMSTRCSVKPRECSRSTAPKIVSWSTNLGITTACRARRRKRIIKWMRENMK